jgi:hypothetical protein
MSDQPFYTCRRCGITYLEGEVHTCPARTSRTFSVLAVSTVPLAIVLILVTGMTKLDDPNLWPLIILFIAVVLTAYLGIMAWGRGEWKGRSGSRSDNEPT